MSSNRKQVLSDGSITVAEQNGNVTFRDKKTHIQASVPSDDFWRAWYQTTFDKGASGNQIYRTLAFIDPDEQSVAVVDTAVSVATGNSQLRIKVRVEKLGVSEDFAKLHKFAAERKPPKR